jgi:hypothetical protein
MHQNLSEIPRGEGGGWGVWIEMGGGGVQT